MGRSLPTKLLVLQESAEGPSLILTPLGSDVLSPNTCGCRQVPQASG